ncbi:uncharacterized protein RHO17_022325 [Thomomys bottae]
MQVSTYQKRIRIACHVLLAWTIPITLTPSLTAGSVRSAKKIKKRRGPAPQPQTQCANASLALSGHQKPLRSARDVDLGALRGRMRSPVPPGVTASVSPRPLEGPEFLKSQ